MTVRDLVERTLKKIGVLASGESAEAAMASDALDDMNAMIDSWKNNGLMIYENEIHDLTLISGQQTYTIGSSGDFNLTRPVSISKASYVSNNIEYPIDIITEAEWAKIPDKETSSDIPTKLYYNPANPLGELNFWPKPSGASSVKIYVPKPVSRFASLNTSVDLPPGYEILLVYGTADFIAPDFGRELRPRQLQLLTETKADIMRKNTVPVYMECDPTGAESCRGRFDIMTGGYR